MPSRKSGRRAVPNDRIRHVDVFQNSCQPLRQFLFAEIRQVAFPTSARAVVVGVALLLEIFLWISPLVRTWGRQGARWAARKIGENADLLFVIEYELRRPGARFEIEMHCQQSCLNCRKRVRSAVAATPPQPTDYLAAPAIIVFADDRVSQTCGGRIPAAPAPE